MEAAHLSSVANQAPDASMDIDMDLDLGPEPEPEPEPIQTESATRAEDAADPFTEEAVYEKVHVRGVDELTTDHIKQFALSHYDREEPTRIEWIDDTSANIIYTSTESGLQALAAFTQVNGEEDASALPPLRLRSAKLLSSHPDSVLQVRSAVKTDRKQPRAHEKSRFYLMHPEHDPRERLRQELADRRRNGEADDGDYTRRRFDDREHRRRRDRDGDLFNADMYDDRGASSYSDSDRGRGGRRRRGPRELFPEDDDRASGRLRNRSASPGRDTLEDRDRIERAGHNGRRQFRERSPQLSRNTGKELFPSAGESNSGARELFPNKPTSSYIPKGQPPSKASNHRRSDAFDASDETADPLGRRITAPFGDGHVESTRNANVELFPDSARNEAHIRGAAREDQGFAIRGAANGMSIKGRGASVRELFPSKYNSNAEKELFAGTLEGRGGRRRRAEDMFS
ncbi:hypothetical protein NUU61_001197 [Penicillium alfredii]|uniref:Nucleotide-binding, alpha-beta plait n=1 Tax=Penicillium alfredii TaxID=1506179 RepID=A0A9W9KRS7_9EURO|nr:uncharacterized protein NUU61_001197 [Penicillium alfredii]KAJ5115438.1 hypothetical protein NUU61_001197 [Penicillium alfredii]